MGVRFLTDKKVRGVDVFIVAIMAMIAILAFAGTLTVIEFFASIGFLIGTKFLSKAKTERIGWLIYAFVHILTGYVFFEKEQFFFFGTQILSVAIATIAVVRRKK
jgi:hypothetical protein